MSLSNQSNESSLPAHDRQRVTPLPVIGAGNGMTYTAVEHLLAATEGAPGINVTTVAAVSPQTPPASPPHFDSNINIQSPPRRRRRRRRRAHSRRACDINAGKVSFWRMPVGDIPAYAPRICIKQEGEWRWVPFKELDSDNFLLYKNTISDYIKSIQSQVRGQETRVDRIVINQPSDSELALMRQLFNNYLTRQEKRRFIMEYSHTILGKGTCYLCLNVAKTKSKCLHFDCPGMCEVCYEKIDDHCPTCNKKQTINCPICKDVMEKDNIGKGENCHHYVCWTCLGKAYQGGTPITKCPLCRKAWHNIN